jgi:hypothetical protein
MSISTTATKVSYAGNNSNSTPYAITFKYLDEAHVTIYADKVDITSNCTFSGDGAAGTGQFTTDAAQAPTVTVTAVLDVPFDQPVVLQETGSLPAKTLEVSGFDRLNMQIRRVWRKAQNVLTFSSDEGSGSTGTADTLVGFDGSGDIAEIPNTTFAQTANNLSDVDAATARTNLGVDAAGTDNSTDVTTSGTGTYVSIGAGQVLTVDPITESDISDLGAYIENVTGSPLSELQDVTITTPSTGQVLSWNGAAWVNTAAGNGDMLAATYDPTTIAASAFDMDNMVAGTTNKLFTATDKTHLDSIETNADVTDTANVTAAGALMDSEVDADIKTLSLPANTTISTFGASLVDDADAAAARDTLAVGTTQGVGATTYNIQAADEGTLAGLARGENSVDLQTQRALNTEVASGNHSALVGGKNNTAANLHSGVFCGVSNQANADNAAIVGGSTNTTVSPRSFVAGGLSQDITSTGLSNTIIGGNQNTISGTGDNGAVLGGLLNEVSGTGAVTLGGIANVASGLYAYAAGRAATASHNGSKVVGDSSVTAISSIANDEFAIQGSALRLDDGNQSAGKVLTCDANGSGNWAAPAKVVYTVATLPASPAQGDVAMVTDANAPTFLSTVASGGAVVTPVFYNGTAWIVG